MSTITGLQLTAYVGAALGYAAITGFVYGELRYRSGQANVLATLAEGRPMADVHRTRVTSRKASVLAAAIWPFIVAEYFD